MRKIFLIASCIFCTLGVKAQEWSIVSPRDVQAIGTRSLVPNRFVLTRVDDTELKRILWSSPLESQQRRSGNSNNMTIMLSDGSTDVFSLLEYNMMEEELASKFPDIKTFIGKSKSDPYRSIE